MTLDLLDFRQYFYNIYVEVSISICRKVLRENLNYNFFADTKSRSLRGKAVVYVRQIRENSGTHITL